MVTARGAHQVELQHVETGERITRWPVDARELLATGAYVLAEDAQVEVDLPAPTPLPPVVTPAGEVDTPAPARKRR